MKRVLLVGFILLATFAVFAQQRIQGPVPGSPNADPVPVALTTAITNLIDSINTATAAIVMATEGTQSAVESTDPVTVQGRGYTIAQIDATTTNTDAAHEIFTGPGTLAWIDCTNETTDTVFLQLYDAATATTVNVGTTTHAASIGFPANANSDGAGVRPYTAAFANGLKVALTTDVANDTAPSGQPCTLGYRQP